MPGNASNSCLDRRTRFDARKSQLALCKAIVALEDVLVRVETGRITLPTVARLLRNVKASLVTARVYGAFTEDD